MDSVRFLTHHRQSAQEGNAARAKAGVLRSISVLIILRTLFLFESISLLECQLFSCATASKSAINISCLPRHGWWWLSGEQIKFLWKESSLLLSYIIIVLYQLRFFLAKSWSPDIKIFELWFILVVIVKIF